ncbi:putative F-box domain-containing protein [Tanacetum coccineum]
MPDKWFRLKWGNYPVDIVGFIYWFTSCDVFSIYIIVSFDLTIEEFKHVYLPDKLAFDDDRCLVYRSIFKLRESLAVVQYGLKADKQVCRVWMMDNSVSKSFMEIFTINLPYASLRRILGFRNNGELIMEMRDDDDHDSVMLVVCEPGSERINRLGISEDHRGSFFVCSYKESLLLHDQPNMYIN